jgi:hypothetical protein
LRAGYGSAHQHRPTGGLAGSSRSPQVGKVRFAGLKPQERRRRRTDAPTPAPHGCGAGWFQAGRVFTNREGASPGVSGANQEGLPPQAATIGFAESGK